MERKFQCSHLFRNKPDRKISYREMAETLGICSRTSKRWVKKDIENRYILREPTKYKCKKYKILLHGRNIYRLTTKGMEFLQKTSLKTSSKEEISITPPQKQVKELSPEDLARARMEFAMDFFTEDQKISLKKWWIQSPNTLEERLDLLNKKQETIHRTKNEEYFHLKIICQELKKAQSKLRSYKSPQSGRNLYKFFQREKDVSPQSYLNSFNKEFAVHPTRKQEKKYAHEGCSGAFFEDEGKNFLRKCGFEHLIGKCPPWWFRSPEILGKTLVLLKKKQATGYKIRNEMCWISSCLKDGGRGYHYKLAKEYTLAVSSQQSRRKKRNYANLHMNSHFLLETIDLIKNLKDKGLVLSFKEMGKLLNKGISFLRIAVNVCLKVLKKSKISNINAFLNWLVSLKDPLQIFEKKKAPIEKESVKEWHTRRLADWVEERLENFHGSGVWNAIHTEKEISQLQPGNQPEDREKIHYRLEGSCFSFFVFEKDRWNQVGLDTKQKNAKNIFEEFCETYLGVPSECFHVMLSNIENWIQANLRRMTPKKTKISRLRWGNLVPEDTPEERTKIHYRSKGSRFLFFVFEKSGWNRIVFDAKASNGWQAFRKIWKEKFGLSLGILCRQSPFDQANRKWSSNKYNELNFRGANQESRKGNDNEERESGSKDNELDLSGASILKTILKDTLDSDMMGLKCL